MNQNIFSFGSTLPTKTWGVHPQHLFVVPTSSVDETVQGGGLKIDPFPFCNNFMAQSFTL